MNLEATDATDTMGGSHLAKGNEVRKYLKTLFPMCLY